MSNHQIETATLSIEQEMSAILPPSGRLSLSDLRGVDIQIRNAHLSIILPGAQVAKSVSAPPTHPLITPTALECVHHKERSHKATARLFQSPSTIKNPLKSLEKSSAADESYRFESSLFLALEV